MFFPKKIALSLTALFLLTTFQYPVLSSAQTSEQEQSTQLKVKPRPFFKKKRKIRGTWKIIESNNVTRILFSEDFKTKNGPDLKVFLSPVSYQDVNGENAIYEAVNLGILKSNKGSQSYIIPESINLKDFSTILIHCEAYEKLWGGGVL